MKPSKIGLPIGLSFDGLWNSDHLLLKIALAVEGKFSK